MDAKPEFGRDSTLLPAGAARLILCERRGDWAVAMRRELAESGVRIYETRSLAECWEALGHAPASFVLVELAAAEAAALLRRLSWRQRFFPLARVAVVADRRLARYEWVVREAGAVHFTCSPRGLGPLAQTVCRHLASGPVPPQSFTERIWAGLPWRGPQDP